MTADEVLAVVQAAVATVLERDPTTVTRETRFKEDLEADSLDLYTLVQELEDTYSIAMPDEEAAKILTVGAAVDYVLDNAPSGAA